MPSRKKRAARYIRESDPSLADSNTIDSQAQYVLDHCLKQGYDCSPLHEYREALSGYTIPYMERPQLLALLEAAKRHEFDVLVISEIRAVSRRQVEVFVIYDMLQKYGVELETVQEKFEDSAMGRLLLSLRAAFAEIEREQIYVRLERGKKHRVANGAPNGHPKAAYGYLLLDTEREVKAVYEFNDTIIYVDPTGKQWSEHTVCLYIFDLLVQHVSLRNIATRLNDLGIPPPKKPHKLDAHWNSSTIARMVTNPLYIGEVWGNRYKNVKNIHTLRPEEEWIRVGSAPAMISKETRDEVQKQLAYNKQDSSRNNRHSQEMGLLRSGYIFCGICGRKMHVQYHPNEKKEKWPCYRCRSKSGNALAGNHLTNISVKHLDDMAWEKIREVLRNPETVRLRVEEIRKQNKPLLDTEAIEQTVATIEMQMNNLFELAKHATNETTISHLGMTLESLEKQRREVQSMLYDVEDDETERAELELAIQKFERWVEHVGPMFLDATYVPTYEEKRLAVRIIGIRVTVYPTQGNYPYRYQIDVTIPEILGKIKRYCVANEP